MLGALGGIGTLVGSGLGMYANYKAGQNMDDVVSKQIKKQKEFQQKGTSIYEKSLAQSTPGAAQGQIDSGAEQARQLYARLASVPMSPNSSQAVSAGQVPIQAAGTSAYDRLIGVPNSVLQGLTNYGLRQTIKDLQANTALGVNSELSRLTASALPYKVEDASHSMDTLSGIGSLLSTFGGLAGQYGAGQQGYNKGYANSYNAVNPPIKYGSVNPVYPGAAPSQFANYA